MNAPAFPHSPAVPPVSPGGQWALPASPPVDEVLENLPVPPWAGLQGAPSAAVTARRFASLSSLPEGRRLPPRRDALPARHQRESAPPPAREHSLTLPGAAPPAPPAPSAVALPAAINQQLGFNCPGCYTVLIIKDPSTYDGRPAPCPTCGVKILPPQRLPDSPFSIVHRIPIRPEAAPPQLEF